MARSGNRHCSSFCRQCPFQTELRTLHRVRVGTWGGTPEGGIDEAARSLETLPYPVPKKIMCVLSDSRCPKISENMRRRSISNYFFVAGCRPPSHHDLFSPRECRSQRLTQKIHRKRRYQKQNYTEIHGGTNYHKERASLQNTLSLRENIIKQIACKNRNFKPHIALAAWVAFSAWLALAALPALPYTHPPAFTTKKIRTRTSRSPCT